MLITLLQASTVPRPFLSCLTVIPQVRRVLVIIGMLSVGPGRTMTSQPGDIQLTVPEIT